MDNMIENIKKEIENIQIKEHMTVYGLQNIILEILDKYKDKEIKFEDGSSKFAIVKVPKLDVNNIKNYNQHDYKSAWNELKNQSTNYITKYLDKFGFVEEKTLNKLIEELEQKYNLGGE